ncbi:MAG: mycothiol system anti-sigma-R factor [Carbonactinosporaceae bacterium]
MSCGNPHEIDCSKVLDRVYEYLDNEVTEDDRAKVRQHLHECHPCFEKYGLEEAVKTLVHRTCGCDDVPSELRSKVLLRIREVRVQIGGKDAGQALED